jgi:hypothetical protein
LKDETPIGDTTFNIGIKGNIQVPLASIHISRQILPPKLS